MLRVTKTTPSVTQLLKVGQRPTDKCNIIREKNGDCRQSTKYKSPLQQLNQPNMFDCLLKEDGNK